MNDPTSACAGIPRHARVELGGAPLCLLADRAVFHAADGTLFAADLHLGKGAALRAAGLPVPGDAVGEDLARLGALADACGAARLVLLGDVVHAREALTPAHRAALAAFRTARPSLEVVLVAGNHDRRALRLLGEAGLRVERAPFAAGPFACVHDPADAPPDAPALAGHLHPVVRLAAGPETLTVPCFWLRGSVLVLPAFGSWTGGRALRPGPGGRVWAVAGEAVLELPGR